VQDELLADNSTKLEHKKSCQYPFNSQNPYNRAIKLLAAPAKSTLMMSESDGPGIPQQVVGVANNKQR
jgi:hypothetical protein